MPPKKRKVEATKQIGIKEALKKKQEARIELPQQEEIEEERDAHICPYLNVYQNIVHQNPENLYRISTFARVWFRENSNINEVLNLYLAKEKLENPLKENLLGLVIRSSMSAKYKLRIQYPFCLFRWNSSSAECVGQLLLMYPMIRTKEDLDDTMEYLGEKKLMLSQVIMFKDNAFYENCRKTVDRKVKKYGPESSFSYNVTATRTTMEMFCRENKQVECFHYETITLDELLQISSFERSCRKYMLEVNAKEENLPKIIKSRFSKLKINPESVTNHEFFFTHPQYALITNNLTEAQELQVAVNIKAFYRCTNAIDIIARNKELLNIFGENAVEVEQQRKKKLHTIYIRQEDKKYPPFHNLRWDRKNAEEYRERQKLRRDISMEAHCSYQQPATVVRNTQAASSKITTTTTPINHISSSSEGSSEIVVESSRPHEKIDKYLVKPRMSEKGVEIVRLLGASREFVNNSKRHLSLRFPDNFESIWKEYRQIIGSNFVRELLEGNRKEFEASLDKFAPSLKADVMYIYGSQDSGSSTQQNFGSAKTSTQSLTPPPVLPPVRKTPAIVSAAQPSTSRQSLFEIDLTEEVLNVRPPKSSTLIASSSTSFAASTPVPKIKTERYSPEKPDFEKDSDCLIVSQVADDCIVISDEMDQVRNRTLEELESGEKDIYQQNLNAESEEIMSASCELQLAGFDLMMRRHDEQDRLEQDQRKRDRLERDQRKQDRLEREENVTKRKVQKRKHTGASGMKYLTDDDATQTATTPEANGNDQQNNHPHLSEETFSVFLSTQLMLDYNRHNIEKTAMTFSKTSAAIASNNNNNNEKSCFIIELKHVKFQSNQVFEISINLPQFALYDVLIRGEAIKKVLNLNTLEFKKLLNNLNTLGFYEFTNGNNNRRRQAGEEFEILIAHHLDLYFATLSKFKHFLVKNNDDGQTFQFNDATSVSHAGDLTSAIDPEMLKKIKSFKNATRSH